MSSPSFTDALNSDQSLPLFVEVITPSRLERSHLSAVIWRPKAFAAAVSLLLLLCWRLSATRAGHGDHATIPVSTLDNFTSPDNSGQWPAPGDKIIVIATIEWEDIDWVFNELPE
jgi:hypothetical protein